MARKSRRRQEKTKSEGCKERIKELIYFFNILEIYWNFENIHILNSVNARTSEMSCKVPEPSVTSSIRRGGVEKENRYIIEQLPNKESSFEESVESVESFVIARNAL